MEKYYLAIDIGASSGRHMLASVADGKMQLEEIYRFPNGMDNERNIVLGCKTPVYRDQNGLKKCKELGRSRYPWGLTHGRLIMFYWTKTTGS